jgi:predicted GNAT family acetyltransferase
MSEVEMEVEFFSKPAEFLSRTGNLIISNEARYSLINGIARRLVTSPHAYGKDDPWFCTVREEKELCIAAMRTPPHKVLLALFSGDPVSIAMVLADSISAFSPSLPRVIGDLEIADPFAKHWCAKHKITIEERMAQRVYRLEGINNIAFSSGKLRLASIEDKELLTRWMHSFYLDALASASPNTPEDDIAPKINRKEVYLWEDSVPVSMAAKTTPTENGIRINSVYTPPEFRNRRYATSCVAMLCKELLDSGLKFCMLYTDLANSTSNSIYKKIGFEEVCDSAEYTFSIPG